MGTPPALLRGKGQKKSWKNLSIPLFFSHVLKKSSATAEVRNRGRNRVRSGSQPHHVFDLPMDLGPKFI